MPDFIAVVEFDPASRRVSKYQSFDNRAEADAHVATFGGFVSLRPIGGAVGWQVNGPGNALVSVPRAPEPPRPDPPIIVAIRRLATNAGVDISDLVF